jgi:hypothetical protein
MFSLLLLIVSVIAMTQFGVYYWRSLIAGLAAQPVPSQVCLAAGLDSDTPAAEDFGALLSLHRLTPGLQKRSDRLSALQLYFGLMGGIRQLTSTHMPAVAAWARSEMATCSRYVAVLLGARLEQNMACAAEIRSC